MKKKIELSQDFFAAIRDMVNNAEDEFMNGRNPQAIDLLKVVASDAGDCIKELEKEDVIEWPEEWNNHNDSFKSGSSGRERKGTFRGTSRKS